MIDGDYVNFPDHLYYGAELYLKYKGVIYFREPLKIALVKKI